MRPFTRRSGAVLTLVSSVLACGSSDEPASGAAEDPSGGAGPSCNQSSRILPLQTVLGDTTHACHAWAARTYGRTLVTSFGGSSSILSVRTPRGTGVLLCSLHELSALFLASKGKDVPLLVRDPGAIAPLPLARRLDEKGYPVSDSYGSIPIFHPAVPAAEAGDVQRILPKHDFAVSVVDGDASALTSRTGVSASTPQISDPEHTASLQPSFVDVRGGDVVMSFGLPEITTAVGTTFAVERVLTDDEARDAVSSLARQGDSEGAIPYDPEVEFIARGDATKGMSGGGAFDRDGRHVGILVRASDILVSGRRIVRFVRTSYVMKQLQDAVAAADAATKAAVAPYLEQ